MKYCRAFIHELYFPALLSGSDSKIDLFLSSLLP